jgi:hypothetical protein
MTATTKISVTLLKNSDQYFISRNTSYRSISALTTTKRKLTDDHYTIIFCLPIKCLINGAQNSTGHNPDSYHQRYGIEGNMPALACHHLITFQHKDYANRHLWIPLHDSLANNIWDIFSH